MNTGNWQSDGDTDYRRYMILNIARLLERKSQRRSCSKKKLVMIAKQIEISLYHQAGTLHEYLDKRTLQQRVREKAIDSLRESTVRGLLNNNLDCNNCGILQRQNVSVNECHPNTTTSASIPIDRIQNLTLHQI